MKMVTVMTKRMYCSNRTKEKKSLNVKPLNKQWNPAWPFPFSLSLNSADVPHLLSFLSLFHSTFFYSFVQSTRLHLEQKGKTDAVTERPCFLLPQKVFSRLRNKWSTRVESLRRPKKALLMWWHVPYASLKNVRYQQQGANPVTWHVIIKETQGIWLVYGGMLFIFLICPWLQCTLSLVVMIQKSKCRSRSL